MASLLFRIGLLAVIGVVVFGSPVALVIAALAIVGAVLAVLVTGRWNFPRP